MKRQVNHLLMKGVVDTGIRVTYIMRFDMDSKYPPMTRSISDTLYTYPVFAISIGRSFDDRLFITSKKYFSFIVILEKAVTQISNHLYEIFPDADSTDGSVNNTMLQIYRTEKAMSIDGITVIPCAYVNSTNETSPGVEIIISTDGSFKLPLVDALIISKMLSSFDAINFQYVIMHMIGLDEIFQQPTLINPMNN